MLTIEIGHLLHSGNEKKKNRSCHQNFSLIREVENIQITNIGKNVKNGLRGIKIKPYRNPKEGGVTFICDSDFMRNLR